MEISKIHRLVTVGFLLASGQIHAEVMDKEPTYFAIWTWTFLASIASFMVCRRWPRAVFWTLPASLIYPIAIWSEVFDPHVGPSILGEGGLGYLASLTVATLVLITTGPMGARRARGDSSGEPGNARSPTPP